MLRSVAIDSFYQRFGEAVARHRNVKAMTQADLARKLGMSRASLANIERGEQRVYLHQAIQMAGELGLEDMSELIPHNKRLEAPPLADVSHSGDRVNRTQERVIKQLVSSITSSTRKQ